MPIWSIVVALVLLAPQPANPADTATITQEELVRRTQELFDCGCGWESGALEAVRRRKCTLL